MIKWRVLTNEDYPKLVEWWKQNRFPSPKFDDLPQVNGVMFGVMVSKHDIEVCAGFLIDTNVPNGSMVEYIVANFMVKDRVIRKECMNTLINTLGWIAKGMGKKYIYTSTSMKNKSYVNRLAEGGFVKGSTDCVELIKPL